MDPNNNQPTNPNQSSPGQQGGFVETPAPQQMPSYQNPNMAQQPQGYSQTPTINEQYNAIPPVGNNNADQPPTPPPRNIQSPSSDRTPPPRSSSYGKPPLGIRIMDWFKGHWWAPVISILVLLLLGDLIYQFAYPFSYIPPGLYVQGVNIGNMTQDQAAKKLDKMYGKKKVEVYFGDATVPYMIPTADEIGIKVSNKSRIQNASYPVWLRFIPTSIMWASNLVQTGNAVFGYDDSTIDKFAANNVGSDCYINPKNASLKLDDGKFAVIPAQPGGRCDINKFKKSIKEAKLGSDGKFTIRADINAIDAPVTDEMARQLGDELNHVLSEDKMIKAGDTTKDLPASVIKGWLAFKAIVPEDNGKGDTLPPRLAFDIVPERVSKYMDSNISSLVEKDPGVTKISTKNFVETSHKDGKSGTKIDIGTTIKSINEVVLGRKNTVIVATKTVPPKVEYNHTYTPDPAGYEALARQFGQDHGGHFGIKYEEIGGLQPWLGGSYRATESFKAGGIESIYLAYAAEAGIEDGSIQYTDKVAGDRNVKQCMHDALSSYDRDCINGLLGKIGNAKMDQRMKAIGVTKTNFSSSTITTTAADLFTIMKKLATHDLPIKDYNVINSGMRDTNLRDGFLATGKNGRTLITVGSQADGAYNEGVVATENGKFVLVVLSDQKDGKLNQQLINDIQDLRIKKIKRSRSN